MDDDHPTLGAQALYARIQQTQRFLEINLAIMAEANPTPLDDLEDLVVAIVPPGDNDVDRTAMAASVRRVRQWQQAIAAWRRDRRQG